MTHPNEPATEAGQARLSRSLTQLWLRQDELPLYDAVVVGSGYGGSVAAAGLAGGTVGQGAQARPARVLVLERGREYLPGEFPARFGELPGHLRLGHQNSGRVTGRHEGLFDIRLGDDVAALVANGLGGGSLINAGVMLEPDPADFKPTNPVHTLVADLKRGGHYQQAARLLGSEVLRDKAYRPNTIDLHAKCGHGELKKTEALQQLGQGQVFRKVPITVSMDGQPNSAGVTLPPCTLCGDCMTGCNIGAKDSLDANLLLRAARAGAEITTGASVLSLYRESLAGPPRPGDASLQHWVLRVVHTDPTLQARETEVLRIRARRVVLAAGTLGSPEILLRSRDAQLAFSRRLGDKFSCNGDNIAAVHRMARPTEGSADEDLPTHKRCVGPTITGSVRLPGEGKDAGPPVQLQEFSVPGPMRQLFEELVTTGRVLQELPQADNTRHGAEGDQALDPMAVNPDAMARSLLVGLIGHDEAAGCLQLSPPLRPVGRPPQQGSLRIHWPDARFGDALDRAQERLQAQVGALPSAPNDPQPPLLVPNPMWRMLPKELSDLVSQPRGPVLTVHPLGGCVVGEDAEHGVVDAHGAVFNPRQMACDDPWQQACDDPWQESLLVLDGSVIPGSLGVNPALTITAIALRAIVHWRHKWLWQAPAESALGPTPRRRLAAPIAPVPPAPPRRTTAVQIVERLHGTVPLQMAGQPVKDHVLELTLAYASADLRSLMSTLARSLAVDSASEHSRVRLYDKATWDELDLRVESDAVRERHAVLDARLSGSLRFLHREASNPLQRRLRAGWAWLLNRGLRDLWQAFDDDAPQHGAGLQDMFSTGWATASRAGEVRRFDYDLRVEQVLVNRLVDTAGRRIELLRAGDAIGGSKRLTYNRRANPWRQLTELQLDRAPALNAASAPVLTLDARFMANRGIPLLGITRQADQAQAMADLASFGLYFARVLLSTHLWTFRKPDTNHRGEPERLPGIIKGLPAPEVTELRVDRMPGTGADVSIRLTRYRAASATGGPPPTEGPPLVMIHGYSVSGNTFTHPSLEKSAAQYFCEQQRDVWVLDLRTSAGLPTATEPWSMEQVALVDIPAALLHIRHVTGKRVDVLAHCIGCVMLSMALLTDARQVRSGQVELGVDAWLTAEQLGTLTEFNGPEREGQEHPCVRRVVLSQKGPVLRYTDSNVLRAFVLQSARRWLLADDFQFRPPARPRVSDELLDRFLSSVPYPDADYDIENPLWPCAKTPWVATRHRMDALYGRDFSAANLAPETLDAIDDLFGPINLDTVSQTIHFARFNAITNQRGRGEFVTRDRLRRYWGGIATMAIHGQDNGLVDVSTQQLLKTHLRAAGVPLHVSPSHLPPYDRMGHQDVLLGTGAVQVFRDIEAFLAGPEPAAVAPQLGGQVLAEPWIGPRIDLLDGPPPTVRVAAKPRPDLGQARLCLLPACWQPGTAAQPGGYPLLVPAQGVSLSAEACSSREWLFLAPALDAWPLAGAGAPAGVAGYLVVLVYEQDEAATITDPGFPHTLGIGPLAQQAPAAPAPGADPLLALAAQWMSEQTDDTLQRCFVRLDDLLRARRLHVDQAGEALCFALASCQYPAGLLDPPVAQASLRALQQDSSVALAVFVGDQIYADATAGLMDPVRRDELYDQPNERALRLEAMRALLRRVPLRTLPDDHEMSDNWEPLPEAVVQRRPADAAVNQRARRHGFDAWRHHQQMRPPPPRLPGGQRPLDGPADHDFRFAGHPFYMLDTRSCRSPRGSLVPAADQDILSERQWEALAAWLRAHRDQVKFVATPSLLLPRRRSSVPEAADAIRSDAWDGYPASLHRLLALLVDEQVQRTVFLSGDEHHSLCAQVRVWRQGCDQQAVQFVSVHSSGLYAPLPFANGRPTDLQDAETFTLGPAGALLNVQLQTTFAAPGDGYARLSLLTGGAVPKLKVGFVKAPQGAPQDIELPLA